MGVELHRVSHNVRHLVVSPVIHALHGVQDASLHGFQAIFDMWHGTIENGIAGIVEEPVLIHTAQMMHGGSVEAVYGFIVRVTFCRIGKFCILGTLYFCYVVSCFVVH